MGRRIQSAIVAALFVVVVAAGCEDEKTNTVIQPEKTSTAVFEFLNHVDGLELQFNQLNYANARGTIYSLSRLQYVVSDVTLHQTDGTTFGMDGIHYVNESNPDTQGFTLGGVPNGTYDMVSFTFGLDESKNIKNKYLNHPNEFHSEMFWPPAMGGDQGLGYHYMKLEGNFEDTPGGTTAGYTTHTGARWLADGNPMNGVEDPLPFHHFFRVYLPFTALAVNGSRMVVTIEVDVNRWYTDPTPLDSFDSEYDWHDLMPQMIMANLAAQEKLMLNGPGCFSADVEAVELP